MGEHLRIGELSERTGASPRSLRYYESRGLMVSQRLPSGQRRYDADHVGRVALIRSFLAAGLSTRTIADMAPCMDAPSRHQAVRAARTLAREGAHLSAVIEDLVRARAALEDLVRTNQAYLADHDGEHAAGQAAPVTGLPRQGRPRTDRALTAITPPRAAAPPPAPGPGGHA